MTHPHDIADDDDRLAQVEALIRDAADYVRPSRDLRPRALEAARDDRFTRRFSRAMRLTAMAAAIVGVAVSAAASWEAARRNRHEFSAGADQQALDKRAELHAARCGGLGWGLVEAFLDLREERTERLPASKE